MKTWLVSSPLMAQWKGGVVGILLGMCITYLLQDTPTFIAPFEQVSNSATHCSSLQKHSTPPPAGNMNSDFIATQHPVGGIFYERRNAESNIRSKQLALLLASWEASSMLSVRKSDDPLLRGAKISSSTVPKAPHLENCQERSVVYEILDAWGENGTLPWTLWRGQGFGLQIDTVKDHDGKETPIRKNLYPPWVEGADEDNLPLTRKVQADIWQHQHPQDCQDPSLRFLLADWEIDPGLGMGAQIASMAGLLALAVNERRILVSNYYNRADHEECVGIDNARWSCYFFDETSKECRGRALFLATQSDAWEQGLITSKSNYTTKQIWVGKTPRQWGRPWQLMQPTTQIDGKLLIHHKASDRRWWRAQAVRYLMRFRTTYMCSLLNEARHKAFGMEAARMVLDSFHFVWPEVTTLWNETEMDRFVWKVHKPWVPRPLISIHVRQGDKAKEMTIFGFKDYMALAQGLRGQFPQARSIWLSTEMQDVIEESRRYVEWWDIYYSNVSRQTGNMTMAAYAESLGRAVSTNYPLVNFLLAAEADFFIGALGSTWCYLIDGMRTTGGKVMAGYVSVNKDRFW